MKSLVDVLNEGINNLIMVEDLEIFNEELLYEFATVRAKDANNLGIVMAVNPTPNYIGNPYFKVYNAPQFNKATKVARISFFKPELIEHQRNKLPWLNMNNKDKKNIIKFLNLRAATQKCTVWEALKYYWNSEKGINVGYIEDYLNGDFDEKNRNNPDYIPSTLKMPNYMELK